jgi:hypothetical protein
MTKPGLRPDNEAPSNVTDHKFVAPKDKPWGLCTQCGLSESVHAEAATPYSAELKKLKLPYRCPYCVQAEEPVCNHSKDWVDEYIQNRHKGAKASQDS